MGGLVPVVAALLGGIAVAVQGPVNSELMSHIGQFRAVFISVLVTFTAILIVVVVRGGPGSFGGLVHAPRWALIGGFMGLISLIATINAVPRIGVAATTGAIVAGQVIAAAVIDRYGLLGVPVRALTPGRTAGLLLIVVAVALVTRG